VVLLQTHSELNTCNFVRMHSDLASLSYIISV